jgi:hypothetical protein
MFKERWSQSSIALALALLLALPGTAVLAVDEEAAGTAVGVEKHDVACAPGDPLTIEVAPSIGRVELTFTGVCYCFDSAAEATTWIETRGQLALTGEFDPELELGGVAEQRVAEPEPGKQVDVEVYCLTEEQVFGYLKLLTPAEMATAGE